MNLQLKSAFLNLNPSIKDAEWMTIESEVIELKLKRKETLFEEGKTQNAIAFINQGLIREYFIDKDGNEKTVWFFKENQFVTDYSAFLQNIPSKNSFTCLEPTEVILIPRDVVFNSYNSYPSFDRFGRLIAEQVLIQLQERIDDFHFLSAEERYIKYINKYPELFQRISLTHLSSFLGIQRQSLSRIRKNLT
jgi:CRP-like cAMP-binding protein